MAAPWWTYPRIDNFGQIDPQGPFWKPDSNIQIPGLYPVAAINSGTVTSLQHSSFGGQDVITIKLDNAFNSLATHQYYEHLSSWTPGLAVGQHVSSGQIIGKNNPAGQVPLGFGFYSGDVYGSGDAWTILQNDLAPGGKGLLNPVKLLDSAKGGTVQVGSGTGSSPNPLTDPVGAFWSSASPTLIQWGEYIAIFMLAVVLVIIGFVLIGGSDAVQAAKKAVSS